MELDVNGVWGVAHWEVVGMGLPREEEGTTTLGRRLDTPGSQTLN